MLRQWKLKLLACAALAAFALPADMASAQSGEPIKIGLSMSLTGPLSPNGKQALLGLQIWEEEVNAKGGLLGRPIKLIHYDDQSQAAPVPGIYTKLLDVDKVDLVLGPYATVPSAAAMPVVMQKQKMMIILFGLGVNTEFKYDKFFAMIPSGPNTKPAFTEGFFEVAMQQNPKPQTVAFVAADQEFSKNACDGAKDNAKKAGLRTVYDRAYPPNTTDFTPVVRAMQAANPDVVAVCSYPLDSVGLVKAVNEVGFKPKMIGGAMVGLQATGIKNQLGSLLNGWTNYETWVPDKKMYHAGTDEFFKKYQARAQAAGVDALGYYLGGWGYAYAQVLEQAIRGAKTLNDAQLAAYIKKNSFKTIHGDIEFGADGEWKKSGMLQVQYHSIKQGAPTVETWRGMDYQTVLTPGGLKTGNLIYPFEKAK
jgi:branched-chain amino acid transport system substrate-binding protein